MRRSKLIYISFVCLAAVSVGACQGTASSDAPGAAAASAAPVRPVVAFREITIPAGTTLHATLDESVGSATSRVDEPVRAHLTRLIAIRKPTVRVTYELAEHSPEALPRLVREMLARRSAPQKPPSGSWSEVVETMKSAEHVGVPELSGAAGDEH